MTFGYDSLRAMDQVMRQQGMTSSTSTLQVEDGYTGRLARQSRQEPINIRGLDHPDMSMVLKLKAITQLAMEQFRLGYNSVVFESDFFTHTLPRVITALEDAELALATEKTISEDTKGTSRAQREILGALRK